MVAKLLQIQPIFHSFSSYRPTLVTWDLGPFNPVQARVWFYYEMKLNFGSPVNSVMA